MLRTASLTIAIALSSIPFAWCEPIDIDSRLELLVDDYLIDTLQGVEHRLHPPVPAEPVIQFDKPWEGRFCAYVTVLDDGGKFRMYYRGMPEAGSDGSINEFTCYAESQDGVTWTKPDLGLFEVGGTRENNIVLAGMAPFSHNFAPFLDTRPGVPADERFKALAGIGESGLFAFASPDGLNWRKLSEEAVIRDGAFDSQNVAFWSEHEGVYACYFRTWKDGYRWISRTTSGDFLNWNEPDEMTFGDRPPEHLYTNQTLPYIRAPHIYLAIAARFIPDRRVISEADAQAIEVHANYVGDCSDAVLLTSRGGVTYDRTFMEAYIRPGTGSENWTSRTNYPARGMVETGPNELSCYVQRRYGQEGHFVQRLTLRTDGFASIHASYDGGQLLTKPLRFSGDGLYLNASTSAAGGMRVAVLDEDGTPIEGFTAPECDELVGDWIERRVTWKLNGDCGALAGRSVRLQISMRDADLYAFRFR